MVYINALGFLKYEDNIDNQDLNYESNNSFRPS